MGWKVQSTNKDRTRGLVVAYVDARTVVDRLDEAVGPEGWHDTYEILADQTYTVRSERGERRERLVEVRCRLTVLGVTKEDVGEGDSLKAAFSDALKRAAVKFGVGRYLYELEKIWVPLKDGQPTEKALRELKRLLASEEEGELDEEEEP